MCLLSSDGQSTAYSQMLSLTKPKIVGYCTIFICMEVSG
uniref:Uncharacterized protein n=1 Tax=Anguilla anguilla TaxID=7936 RepID=A0A0E9UJJ5_ANGAN